MTRAVKRTRPLPAVMNGGKESVGVQVAGDLAVLCVWRPSWLARLFGLPRLFGLLVPGRYALSFPRSLLARLQKALGFLPCLIPGDDDGWQ
jgi:hypothetical protein